MLNNMTVLELQWGKCKVTITTNKPEVVKNEYETSFGAFKKITFGFREIINYICNNHKDVQIVLNSMKSNI